MLSSMEWPVSWHNLPMEWKVTKLPSAFKPKAPEDRRRQIAAENREALRERRRLAGIPDPDDWMW